jgi:hypothetical protein
MNTLVFVFVRLIFSHKCPPILAIAEGLKCALFTPHTYVDERPGNENALKQITNDPGHPTMFRRLNPVLRQTQPRRNFGAK